MVNSLDSGLRAQSLRPVNVLCSWARHFTLKVSLLTQEHKWVQAKCQGSLVKSWGIALCWSGIPSRGRSVPLVASCYGKRDKFPVGEALG